MSAIDHLFEANRAWSERMRADDPAFFERLAKAQAPEYLWIGCADSRVPARGVRFIIAPLKQRAVAEPLAAAFVFC